MKFLQVIIAITLISFFATGCTGRNGGAKDMAEADTLSVPDTGYTGIKQFMSNNHVVKEVTYKNGVVDGLTKSFYPSGRLRQTFWYENGLRQDSSKWFYEEGQLFRSTPFRNDTIDGIQKQYYRTGQLRARLEFKKGFRTPFLEEYTRDGRLINDYPEIVTTVKDQYAQNGTYRISLSLSDKSTRVRFYRGGFRDGLFDTTKLEKITVVNGAGNIVLKKNGPGMKSIDVIAEAVTGLGNNKILYKKIDLPYSDLK